jgi:hypothetical protein
MSLADLMLEQGIAMPHGRGDWAFADDFRPSPWGDSRLGVTG